LNFSAASLIVFIIPSARANLSLLKCLTKRDILAQSLSENKNKPEVLKALVGNLAKIAHQKYPKIVIYEVEKKT